jgi:hypothetical protein
VNEQAAGGVLFLILALGAAVVVALLLYEAWALLTTRTPITWFARLGVADHPRIAFVVAFAIGMLGGHLFWR